MFECEDWRFPEPAQRGRSMEDVFRHHLEPLGVPVVFNLPLGHGAHLATIPLGARATVDADERRITFEETGLSVPGPGGETAG
jgi:muramoyltetrapeptide carboxypeptidase